MIWFAFRTHVNNIIARKYLTSSSICTIYSQKLLSYILQEFLYLCEGRFLNGYPLLGVQFRSVAQSCPTLCNPMDNSQSLLKFMSIESVMLSNPLILCFPHLLLPSVFPSIRVFSSELALCIKWHQDASASASVLPVNIQD